MPKAPPPRLPPQPRRSQIPWKWVGLVFTFVTVALVWYFVRSDRQLRAERSRILRTLSGMKGSVQTEYGKLREQVEGWTSSAATKPYAGDLVDRDARALNWRERPALYLRLRVEDAKTLAAVHTNAKAVAIDSIASCLLRARAGGPWPYGEVVTRMEMLGVDFINDVSTTTNDLRMRNLSFALDYYEKNDFPTVRDATKQAEFFVLALDEDPTPMPTTSAAFGATATPSQRIASVTHPIQLHVWKLLEGREILRVRRTPEANVVQVQGDVVGPAAGIELRKAQALGCSLATEALDLLGDTKVPSMTANALPEMAAPAPSTSASAVASSSAPAASMASAPAAGASLKRP